jgi:hypothetical protein
LDRSPTGTGKSRADDSVAEHLDADGRVSLTLLSTHQNCREVVRARQERGIASQAYPQLTEANCMRYQEAIHDREAGLQHTQTICPDCPHQDECEYRQQLVEAMASRHPVATHARAIVQMPEIAEGASYISIQEDAVGVLRPAIVVGHGLDTIRWVADLAAEAARPQARPFYRHFGRVAASLERSLNEAERCRILDLPPFAAGMPEGVQKALHEAIRKAPRPPLGDAMRLVLAAVSGDLITLAVFVDEMPGAKGGKGTRIVRHLVGLLRSGLPYCTTTVIGDRTANPKEIQLASGKRVRDITPEGELPLVHPILQVLPPRNITKGRKPGPVADLLRGLVHDLPADCKLGLITHQKLSRLAPKKLGDPYAAQLALVSHFRSGLSRGSNEWLDDDCDDILVAGTPRVPTLAIRVRLLQTGKLDAACLDKDAAGWFTDTHSVRLIDGTEAEVRSPRYRNDDWHQACLSLVTAELIQCIGRGRGHLDEGKPVIVVSTEHLPGIPVSARMARPFTKMQQRIWQALHDADGCPLTLKTDAIAETIDLGRSRTAEILKCMEEDGRVRKARKRKGWQPVPRPAAKGEEGTISSGVCLYVYKQTPDENRHPSASGSAAASTVTSGKPQAHAPKDGRKRDPNLFVKVGPYTVYDSGVEDAEMHLPWHCRSDSGETRSQRKRREAKQRWTDTMRH